jgi:hypothetical protein
MEKTEISGKWHSEKGDKDYEITQFEDRFEWKTKHSDKIETGVGMLKYNDELDIIWNNDGGKTDPPLRKEVGKLLRDASGRVVKIEWGDDDHFVRVA